MLIIKKSFIINIKIIKYKLSKIRNKYKKVKNITLKIDKIKSFKKYFKKIKKYNIIKFFIFFQNYLNKIY